MKMENKFEMIKDLEEKRDAKAIEFNSLFSQWMEIQNKLFNLRKEISSLLYDLYDESEGEAMYRQYEDPKKIKAALEQKKRDFIHLGQLINDMSDRLLIIHDEIEDLEQRLNFAYQDQEYDESEG